jgi:hypothetical protein
MQAPISTIVPSIIAAANVALVRIFIAPPSRVRG